MADYWDRAVAAAKKQKKATKKPAPAKAKAKVDRQIVRAVRTVGATTKAPAKPVAKAARKAVARAPKVDPVVARGDLLAQAPKAKATPEQEDLMRKVRAAYVSQPGSELLGGKLEAISREADPLINFTEKVTRPFTTPASVTAALIDADPTNAIKQLVSATYWGRQRFPSEALNDRGWLPGGNAGLLLGLGADIAPSFTLPGFKTAGKAAGSQAARSVSRGQRLPRTTTARVPVEQQAARLGGRPAPRQQRAVRLQPDRGPDIITSPQARVVPMRPRPGGEATRGGRPRPAETPPKRAVAQLPYAPTSKVQRAMDDFKRAVAHYEGVTVRQPTRLRAARAGQRVGRAESALATAERATVARIRNTSPTLTRTQQAQIEARLPGGATQVGVRPAALMNPARGPDLPPVGARPINGETRPLSGTRPEAAPVFVGRSPQGLRLPRTTATARQQRLAAPSKSLSVFDDRPHTLSELRGASHTPLEGLTLPRLRARVNQSREAMAGTVRRVPTEKQIGKAGQRLAKAEAKLRKIEKALYKKPEKKGATRAEPTSRQTDIHRDTFTGSREREWIDANLEYEAAFREGIAKAPIGVNVTLPFRFDKKGVTIPVATGQAAAKVRAAFSNGHLGEALSAYRHWVVSRYGPNETVRMGAIAADDVVRLQSGRSARFVRDETRKARLNEDDLILASHWLEGTATGVVPIRVQNYAMKMANLTERNLDEFLQAGGKVKRFGQKLDGGLDRQYVLHLLPKGEWDDFAISTLARRQMLYGKRPGFTKKREVLTIRDLKAAGFHPVERLDELTFARAMAHHRALAEMELTRSVARRFGKKAGEAPDDWQAIPSQFTDSDVMVPKDVAQTLRNVIAARMALPSNKGSAALQGLNGRWKEWTLLNVGHDIRNQLGDSALQFQNTLNPVAPLLSLTFGAKTMTGKGKVGGKSNLTSAQAKRLAETSGMRDTGLLGGDVLSNVTAVEAQGIKAIRGSQARRPVKALNRGVRFGRTYREGVNKTGIFTRELRKGEGAVHASRVAKDTIYDYADVGKGVNFARRNPVMPFATWTAKNLPAQIRLAAQRPGQLSAALTGIESLRKQTGGWPRFLKAEWLRERVPIPIPGVGNVSFDLPISSLNLIPTGSLGGGGSFMDTVRAWQGQLGPLLQSPVAAKGIDPLTGNEFRGQRPASRMEQFLQMFPVTAFFLGGSGDKVMTRDSQGRQVAVPASKDDFLSWVFRQATPGFSTAGRLSGSEGRNLVDSLRGPVFGHNLAPFFDPVKVEALQRSLAYEYRNKVGDFNRRMKANAPDWKRGDPIPKHLQGNYREILRIVAQGEWIAEALRQTPRSTR